MYAIIDAHGELISVTQHETDAHAQAAVVARGKEVYIETPEDGFDMMQPNPEFGGHGAKAALQAAKLPVVTWNDVLRLTDGFADATEAYRVLKPHYPSSDAYASPSLMAKAFIGQNYKTSKTVEGFNGIVMGLSLAPYWKAWDPKVRLGLVQVPRDKPNFCIGSNALCRAGCLVTTGQNVASRQNMLIKFMRSKALAAEPQAFCAMLAWSIARFLRYTEKRDLRAFVRLNVYSDLPWELFFPDLFQAFPQVQLYDYSKVPGRRPIPENYDLTFSYSGTNGKQAESEIAAGRRVAVVFLWPRKKPFPRGFKYLGLRVVDGDISDLRPLDPEPCIVGLRYKIPKGMGVGAQDLGAFVVPVQRDEHGNYIAPHTARQSHADEFEA
jgi:hypothetical protein